MKSIYSELVEPKVFFIVLILGGLFGTINNSYGCYTTSTTTTSATTTTTCGSDFDCDPCNCESCVDGECKVCGGDPNKFCCEGECCKSGCEFCWEGNCVTSCDVLTECCPDNTCKPKCIPYGGGMCSYELPPHLEQDVCPTQDGNWLCAQVGKDCGFKETAGPYENAICQPGCTCDLDSTWCVKYSVACCQNGFIPGPPFMACKCKPKAGAGELQAGNRDICGLGEL